MFGIVANVLSNDKLLRRGARVYLLHATGSQKPVVYGMAKWGKKIEKFIPFNRLGNFRAAFLPPAIEKKIRDSPLKRRVSETHLFLFKDRSEAEKRALGQF